MSDDAELARLRTRVRDLREITAQQQWAIDAERTARRAAEADAAQLRTAARTFLQAGSYAERFEARAELEVLATVDHPGVLLLQELEAARKFIATARLVGASELAQPAERAQWLADLHAYKQCAKGTG